MTAASLLPHSATVRRGSRYSRPARLRRTVGRRRRQTGGRSSRSASSASRPRTVTAIGRMPGRRTSPRRSTTSCARDHGRWPALGGGVVRGVQDLQAAATDTGGGARSVSIRVNGIYSRGVDFCQPNYNGSYTALKPCPSSASATRDRYPAGSGWTNGPNDVVICSSDVGGNVSSPCIRRTVQVDNSCPGSGGTSAADLEAGADIGGQLKARAPVTSNVQPVIRGALKDGAGNPVAGATVCLYETIDLPDASRELSARRRRRATDVSRPGSRPAFPRLDLVYRYNDKLLGARVQLDSRVVPTLKIPEKSLENGESALFVGRVPGPNAEGRAVAMQARVGRKWRTFKQLRTDSDGRFRGKYRFTQTSGRVRYVFRPS